MNFRYENLNERLFDKVIAFSYSMGSGLGGPGMIVMLTRDGKEYLIGQEGFEENWLYPEHTFPFMAEAFLENSDKWFRISKKYASEKIYCLKEFQSQVNNVIENYRKKDGLLYNWESMIWQILGIDDVEHIIYDKTEEFRERDEQKRKQSEEHYLTNLYSKNSHRINADNKPEYTGGSDDLLEQRYLGEHIPVYDDASSIWCVQTGHGFESGAVDYIAAEFSGTGLIYHFMRNGQLDHVHGFEGVLAEVLQEPENVDIVTDYGEYSQQEIQMVKGIKRAVTFVQLYNRPMTNTEVRENRSEIKNKGEDNFGYK